MVKLDGFATSVARFNADSDRANLNCNEDPQNSKSDKDENASLGITHNLSPVYHPMKTYKNLYKELCSLENLERAFKKAKKRKSKKHYIIEFEGNLEEELNNLHHELASFTYQPRPLIRFIIRDPKTRTIHASDFRDKVVYHALVNVLNPIFEPIFIFDSYASRKNKGTHKAIQRFDCFKRKVTNNGQLIKNPYGNNSVVGYVLKADIRHYFDTVDHEILLNILRRKIKDKDVMWLVKKILDNFDAKIKGKGMPLGNLTSQFFANIYLNELDQFVKHELKAKYYMRYVDDFIILHDNLAVLEEYKEKIEYCIKNLGLELHPEKSKIMPLKAGVTALGYRNFYHYKLLRISNKRKFEKYFHKKLQYYREGFLSKNDILKYLQGWFGYAQWANTYKYRKEIVNKIDDIYQSKQ